VGERERNRCRDRLEALTRGSLDAEQARREAIVELRRAVGFDRWCGPLTDPDSALSTSGIGEFDFWPSLAQMVALEEHGDITSKPRLVLDANASIALSGATRGDLARSRRWRECLQPYGIGDELMTVCRDRHGCWGSVELMRDTSDRPFGEDELRLLRQVAPTLGTLLRGSLARVRPDPVAEAMPPAPATLILDRDLRMVGWTATLREWLARLPTVGDMLPPAAYEIAARVLTPHDAVHGLPVRVRIGTPSGAWIAIEGARLEGSDPGRVAVTIRAATADETFDLLCKVHDFTTRERQLAGQVRGGLGTRELAVELGISSYTVQDHLKSIFDKTGVRSRRELVSHLTGSTAVRLS
jgi:DNA-binding CsgD family transcriptional regulator